MSRSKIAALENLPKKPKSPDDLPAGESLCGGRFELEGRLGKGGVATVYRANDTTRGCSVALKVLHEGRANDPRELQRFRNEIEINRHIEAHPHLLQPFETGTIDEDSRPFLLSELGRGPTLELIIILAPLDETRALDLFEGIATGLGHMHAAGVLHRDVKPSNVIVEKDGDTERARLLDFGYAISLKDIRELPPQSRLTLAGELPGTKHYMAPEQVLGYPASVTSDIYSLGVSLYQALAGSPPYADLEPADAAIRKATEGNRIPDIRKKRGDLRDEVAALVMDALAADPAERVPDTQAFIDRLRAVREGLGKCDAPPPVEDSEPVLSAPEFSNPSQPAANALLLKLAAALAFVVLTGVAGFWLSGRQRSHVLSAIVPGLKIPLAQSPVPAEPPLPEPAPEQPLAAEPAPTPEPAPEPESEPAIPKSLPTPEPKPAPSPEPEPAIDCNAERAAAAQAFDWRDWNKVVRNTKHPKCWNSRRNWEKLRVRALHQIGDDAACRKLARKSKHPAIRRWVTICSTTTTTETPQ